MQSLRKSLSSVALFLRFEYLVFALLLPILGAAAVRRSLPAQDVLWLLASALCFHIFISLQNDVVDLKLDRTDPRRVNHPLVRGTVSVRVASILALFQVPLVLALSLRWGLHPLLAASIALVIGMMSIYNLWGKRTAFPMGTDFAQGIGFAGLALYGTASMGAPTPLSSMVFWGVALWMMQTNFLGGIRDLRSDFAFGASTTPISLGSRYGPNGCFLSRNSRFYSTLLLAIQFAVPILFLWADRGQIEPATLGRLALGVFLVALAAVSGLARFFATASREGRVEFDLALIVMYLSALPMLAVLAWNNNPWVLMAASVVLLAALRTYLRFMRVLP